METLKEYIKKQRPNISESSIKTYNSILTSLYKKIFKSNDIDIKNFDKHKEILDHLKTLEPNKRKTILSALVVITGLSGSWLDSLAVSRPKVAILISMLLGTIIFECYHMGNFVHTLVRFLALHIAPYVRLKGLN